MSVRLPKYRPGLRRSGMALMLVIPAVALAAVLSYAVLANVGTQDQISANAAALAQADCQAESGINYAMYELQQPFGTSFGSSSIWAPATTATSLGGNTQGSFLITLSNTSYLPAGATASTATSFQTTITSTGTAIGGNGATVSRQISVTVQVPLLATYPNEAAGINGSLTLGSGMQVGSDLRGTGTITLGPGSSVAGTVYAQSLASSGGADGAFVQEPGTSIVAPTTLTTSYQTYKFGGQTYSATRLTTNPAAGTTLGPTASNPAGVYYSTGNLVISGITVNGTLSVGGGLTVQGTTANTINAASNFPGLIVGVSTASKLTVNGTNVNLTVNGLAWVKQGITRSGTSNAGSSLNFNGGLLIPQPTGTGLGTYNGAMTLKYNAQYATVPGFSSQMQVPKNIQVLSWSQ